MTFLEWLEKQSWISVENVSDKYITFRVIPDEERCYKTFYKFSFPAGYDTYRSYQPPYVEWLGDTPAWDCRAILPVIMKNAAQYGAVILVSPGLLGTEENEFTFFARI